MSCYNKSLFVLFFTRLVHLLALQLRYRSLHSPLKFDCCNCAPVCASIPSTARPVLPEASFRRVTLRELQGVAQAL